MKKKAISIMLVLCMLFGIVSTGCGSAEQGLNVMISTVISMRFLCTVTVTVTGTVSVTFRA